MENKFSVLKYVGLAGLLITAFFQFRGLYLSNIEHHQEDIRIQEQVTEAKIDQAKKRFIDSLNRAAYRDRIEQRVTAIEKKLHIK